MLLVNFYLCGLGHQKAVRGRGNDCCLCLQLGPVVVSRYLNPTVILPKYSSHQGLLLTLIDAPVHLCNG